ncbi:MAG: ABC transporter substrate-binding protein [Burkholderiaceae bacterium]|nr:ABC transporter substrate-binding protein [Burkholderiaceae bacterium]MDO9089600.1 ABC transporter substrate-binding protein [Burkholderiaceae bacterium]
MKVTRPKAGFLPVAFMAVLLSAASLSANAQTPGVTPTEIRIGAVGPASGPNYIYGRLPLNGVETVIEKVNLAGGIHGRKITLVRQDDQCDPATSIAVTRRLIHSEKVFAIIGSGCSNAMLAIKPELTQTGTPFVNIVAAADSIANPPVKNIFTTNLSSALESRAQVQYAIASGAKRIAIISLHDAWGRDRYNPMIAEMKRLGITPVADEEISADANSAAAQILKIRAANADAIMLLTYSKPTAIILRDAVRMQFKPSMIATSAVADPLAVQEQAGVPGATDKFVTISPVRYTPSSPEAADWRQRLERMFPKDNLSAFNLFGVGGAQVIFEALRRAGPDLTQDKFIAAMGGIKNLSVDVFPPGSVTCNSPSDHRCVRTVAWIRAKDGKNETMGTTRVD